MLQIDIEVKNKCVEMRHSGIPNREIYDNYFTKHHTGMNFETFRHKIKEWKKKMPNNTAPTLSGKTSIEYKDTGDRMFEGIIELLEGEPITPEIVMQAHNLDIDKWHVVSFKSNAWQSQIKGGRKIALWQSKITVRPKQDNEITFADIDNYFANKKFNAMPATNYKYVDDGETLEVTYVDPHNGLLSWRLETGEDYDLKIARQRFIDCAYDIKARCEHKKIKRIIFPLLGDILHTDNDRQTTEKGTFQQVDGRYPKIEDSTIDTIVDVITILKTIAPVEVIWVSGNHSRNSEYLVMKCVSKCFTDVKFDITPNPIKDVQIGNALIGLAHGDMPKKNITNNVDKKARLIGGIEYIEQHCGHYHSEITTIVNGITVRYLPPLCSSSYWEHQQGYLCSKAMICFVWSDKRGIRDTWTNNI